MANQMRESGHNHARKREPGAQGLARQSLVHRKARQAMQIVNLMTGTPITITPQDSLAHAKQAMDAGRFRRLPVIEAGKLVGIITERDLREHIGFLEKTRVDAAMRAPVITVSPYQTVYDATRLMLENKIGGMPVVSSDGLLGIVTTSDLLKAFMKQGSSV